MTTTRIPSGPLRGEVVARADPLRLGRLRVRVAGVHSVTIPDEDLPWCFPALPASDQCGIWWIPPIGSWVRVVFEGNDHEVPVWLGGWWGLKSPAFGEGEVSNGSKRSGHRFPTSWFGSQDRFPDNSILRTERDGDPINAPNNFTFTSPLQKRLELDDRLNRQRLVLLDFLGNGLMVNSEDAVVELSSGSGVKQEEYKPRGIVLDRKNEAIQVYSDGGWRITVDDKNDVFEASSREGHLIRIDQKNGKIESWTKDGLRMVMDDGLRRIETATPLGRRVILDDTNGSLDLMSPDGSYLSMTEAEGGLVELFSAGKIAIKGVTGINLSSAGPISVDGQTFHLNSGFLDLTNKYESEQPSVPTKPDRAAEVKRAFDYPYFEHVERS